MRHQNSVLHGLPKQVPWDDFDRLVSEHGADARVRRLTTRSQLVALLYGQLAGASSLREIEAALASHAPRLYHLGARTVSRSTLAEANAARPAAVFAGLFGCLLGQARPSLRRASRDAVRLIDSTGLRLGGLSRAWAAFSPGVCGAKLHVLFDPEAERPLFFAVTAAKVHSLPSGPRARDRGDITPAKTMPIEPGASYVFDLGYYDFGFWAALDASGCRFVTRLKRHTQLTVTADRPVAAAGPVLSDRIGRLPTRLSAQRRNPMAGPVRELRVRLDDGKSLRLVTNDLDAPAEEIAGLHQRRWQVELFFRWVKQTLKIKRFLGTSENAVRIQIAVALIAFLLLRSAHRATRIVQSPLAFARLVRANLMHRRALDTLLRHEPSRPPDNQLHLALGHG